MRATKLIGTGAITVVLVIGSACSGTATPTGSSGSSGSTGSSGSAPHTTDVSAGPRRPSLAGYTPTYEPGPCPVTPSPGFRVDCGTVNVPEDRGAPAGRQVRLAVARIHATGPAPAPDPIVRLEGGPGFGSLDGLSTLTGSVLTERRDLVWFDQRGTGTSTPSLDCPEREEAVWEVLGASRPYEQELTIIDEAMRRCHDRLVEEGVQLAQYNTATNAADVADIRRALGISAWNLQATSYGTALAQEVLRSYPEGVRSVLLDSVYPVDERAPSRIGEAAANGVEVLAAGCAAAPVCKAAHPDLAAEIRRVVDDYDAQPFALDLPDPGGRTRHVVLDGADIQAGLFNAQYDETLLPALPLGVQLVGQRNTALINAMAAEAFGQLFEVSEGMFYAVECQDRFMGVTREQVVDVIARDPRMSELYVLSPPAYCDTWGDAAVPAFTDPVTWDGPVLVLAGIYDPVTPADWSRRVAGWFPGSTFVLFDGTAHGVFRSNDCANQLVIAFYEAPTARLDTTCSTAIGPPQWVVTPAP